MMARRQACGFTLVELIVSLTLMAILMLALLGAMRSIGVTEEKLDKRLAVVEEVRSVSSFLDDILGASALKQRATKVGTPGESTFVGTPLALQWIGVMPARHGAGGLHHFRVASEMVGGETALTLAYLPFAGLDVAPEWAQAQRRVLVPHLSALSIQYQLADAAAWLPEWRNTAASPALARVRLAISADGVDWPEQVVAVHAILQNAGGVRIVVGAD
jgi:general secretion pathway protein J